MDAKKQQTVLPEEEYLEVIIPIYQCTLFMLKNETILIRQYNFNTY